MAFPRLPEILAAVDWARAHGIEIGRQSWGNRECMCPLNAVLTYRRQGAVPGGLPGAAEEAARRLRASYEEVIAFTETLDAGRPCSEWVWESSRVRAARAAALEIVDALFSERADRG